MLRGKSVFTVKRCKKDEDEKCSICQSTIRSCGKHCVKGHELGAYYKIVQGPLSEPEKVEVVECQANGARCTICGGYFGEMEDICSLGQHEIGRFYLASNTGVQID